MIEPKDLGLGYLEAMHGVQSGVAYDIANGGQNTTPKHLRVGINSAMVDTAAMAWLLVKKGIIKPEEYAEAVRLFANNELAAYEEQFGVSFR